MESEAEYNKEELKREIHFKSGKTLKVTEEVAYVIANSINKRRRAKFQIFKDHANRLMFVINFEEIELIL